MGKTTILCIQLFPPEWAFEHYSRMYHPSDSRRKITAAKEKVEVGSPAFSISIYSCALPKEIAITDRQPTSQLFLQIYY